MGSQSLNVTVLGGGGFIGANLVARLVADGHRVTAVDTAWPSFRRKAWDGADRYTLNLTVPAAAEAAVAGADWVFHLAADMGGVGYFHGPADLQAAMTNGLITANVLSACVKDETPRVFYSSSACVYPIERQMDLEHPAVLAEDLIGFGTPDALYGAEKLHGLRLCSKIPQARVGVFHTTFGPLQEHEGRRMKFPAAVATKALAARETGTLELWGDGRQLRSYLYIDDAIDRVLTVMASDAYEGPVNIGASGAISCADVARICLEHVGVPDATVTLNEAEPSGVLARDCDNSKYQTVYGDRRERSYRAGFGAFIDWLDSL